MDIKSILTEEDQEKILLSLFVMRRSSDLSSRIEEGYVVTPAVAVLLADEPCWICLMKVRKMSYKAELVIKETFKENEGFFFNCVAHKNFYLAKLVKNTSFINSLVAKKDWQALIDLDEGNLVSKYRNANEN